MRQVLVPLSICSDLPDAGGVLQHVRGTSMGTTWSVRAIMPAQVPARQMHARMQAELDLVVAQMSHWEPDSNLSRYNSAAAGTWHALPDPFFHVLRYALEVAQLSGGAYDPCAGALVNSWGFGARARYDEPSFYAPAPALIEAIVARADRTRIAFDGAGRRLLQAGGVQLDLSSVAKGYAVDRLGLRLEAEGVRHYLVEVGGELRGAGTKPDSHPWWVQLEGVPGAGAHEAVVALHGLAVATSGDYRRYFQHGARRASHTLDPRSGQPIRDNVASVTVIHAECMAADALSTALSVLGPEAGLALAERLRIAARFLVRTKAGLDEIRTSSYAGMLDE